MRTDGQTEMDTLRQTDRQTDRWTEKQKDVIPQQILVCTLHTLWNSNRNNNEVYDDNNNNTTDSICGLQGRSTNTNC
jgi:hypothetical protein